MSSLEKENGGFIGSLKAKEQVSQQSFLLSFFLSFFRPLSLESFLLESKETKLESKAT